MRLRWAIHAKWGAALVWAACCTHVWAQGQGVSFASSDPALSLFAQWWPVTTTVPRPVVIGLHGCSGVRDTQGRFQQTTARDAAFFHEQQWHYLALDSFTSRGVRSICEIPAAQRPVNENMRRQDVAAAIAWLQQQPEVDITRVVVLGRSHGAQTVLALLQAQTELDAPPIRAAVALYPGCSQVLKNPHYRIRAPLLLLVGELDDWTPAAPCLRLAQRLQRQQPAMPLVFHIYPDSYHGFDSPNPPRVRDQVASTASGRATVGGHPVARADALQRIRAFLAEHLANE